MKNEIHKNRFKKLIDLGQVNLRIYLNSSAHKPENVCSLSDILIRDLDVRTYFTGRHGSGKILHFAGSGHHRILELLGGNLLSRDP